MFKESDYHQQLKTEVPACSVGLDAKIDSHPLIVAPSTPLQTVMQWMIRGNKDIGDRAGLINASAALSSNSASYVLVAEAGRLVGIITERDIVKLTAQSVCIESLKAADVMTQHPITISPGDLSDCLLILGLFRQHKIRHLPVISDRKQIVGVATHRSICEAVQPTVLLKLRQVEEVMSTNVVSAMATVSVIELARLMALNRVSCVVITAKAASDKTAERSEYCPEECLEPIGIVTERDIVQYQSQQMDLQNTLAETVMSTPLTCLLPTDSLWAAYEAMQHLGVRRLVIINANQSLAGILTQTSLLSVLNPAELCTTVDILKQQLDQLRDEKVELLRSLNESLSIRVEDSEARFRSTFEQAATGIVHVSLQGHFLQANQKFCDIVGYSHQELLSRTVSEITAAESLQQGLQATQRLIKGEVDSFTQEKQYRRRDGSLVWAAVTVSRVVTAAATPDYLVAVVEDIDARKAIESELSLYRSHLQQMVADRTAELQAEVDERRKVEQQLFAEKELAQVTLHSIGDAVATTDAEGYVNYLNPVAEALTGWTNETATGRSLSEVCVILNETTRQPVQSPVERVLRSGHPTGLANHTVLISRSGLEYSIDDSAAPLCDREGKMIGAVMVFRDATHARQISRQLSWQAGHDALTSLVNRRKFEQILTEAHNAVEPWQQHALCYLDLDQFKIVNDTCGHTAGDELLRQVSALLGRQIRAADTVARLGGDEFAILLHQCPLARALMIANQLRRAIADFRFVWKQETFHIGVSIGLVMINSESTDIAGTLSAADAACYSAKSKGRNRVQIYQPDAAEIVEQRGQQRWSLRIKKALARGQFCLYQQKIVPASAATECVHAEILLRMVDDEGQLILPAAFIPAAERYDLMGEIDQWVVKTFFSQLANAKPNDTSPSHSQPSLYMINLSGATVGDEQFLSFLKAQLTCHAVDPQRICFEITETSAITNLSRAMDFIFELKQLGFSFALDDFGSGMSSFAYLKTLPVDYIKIDGKFVTDLNTDPTALAIVEAINDIVHVMKLKTIAEFVETERVQNSLREIGVDFMQGYGIHRPVPLLL